MFSVLFILSCALVNILSANLGTHLQQCKTRDDACVTNIIKSVYPLILTADKNIGAEEMDPLFQELIEANLDTLKFKVQNITTRGFRLCEVESAKYIDKFLQINFLCPKYIVSGLYEIEGTLLTTHIEGDGDFELETNKYSLNVELEMQTVTKDGKNYNHVKSFKFTAKPLDNIKIELRNLFNGQKSLSDGVNKFLNENSKEVLLVVQDPVFRANIEKIVRNINKYLKTISKDEYELQ